MKKFASYLRDRPWMVIGTSMIVITFFLEKILIRSEQEKIQVHDSQTIELLHTQSYISEKFMSRYLLQFNKNKIADSALRDRLERETLAEYGNALINLDFMNRRRGLSSEELKELVDSSSETAGKLFLVVEYTPVNEVERFVDSLGNMFMLSKFKENQKDPYERSFKEYIKHQDRLSIYTYSSIVLYALGTVLLAVHAYLTKKRIEKEEEDRYLKLKSFLQPAITAIKRDNSKKK